MEILEQFLRRYEKLAIDNEQNRKEAEFLAKEYRRITDQVLELDRTIAVLKKTIRCHQDFEYKHELTNDFEKFKDEWLGEEKWTNGLEWGV